MESGVSALGSDGGAATASSELPPETHPASVLGKAHLLLSAFLDGPSSMGLTELSRRAGVPKATAHRLGTELASLGYLARTADGYQLGWRIYELGKVVPGPANLTAVARPVLLDLRHALRAIVVHLTVPQGAHTVYLERMAGRREIGPISVMGERAPSLLAASGRVFLANDPHRQAHLAEYDAYTIARFHHAIGTHDLAGINRNLDEVLQRRWAAELGECVSGMKTFAVPILSGGQVVAAISASVRSERREEREILHVLWSASAEVSRALDAPPSRQSAVI